MKMKKPIIIIVLILGVILISWWYFTSTMIIEKPEPNLTVDISPFIKAGCVKEKNYLSCPSINLEEKYSCNRIALPSKYLGGLLPKVPIVECTFWKKNWTTDEGIILKGCVAPILNLNKYIVLINGEFKLINNKEEFKQFFAPVETPEEALSFVVALTNSYPMYDIKIPPRYVVFKSKIEATYVKEISEGFKVHLFDYQLCGCGPHLYYAVDYLVTNTGEIQEISRQKIYKDPMEDGLCVD